MYKIVNNTCNNLILPNGEELHPKDSASVVPSLTEFPNYFNSVELGSCAIKSEIGGKHTAACYGSITCTPSVGRDGTFFILSKKD